jgi:Spy/CpxP family protein refolding chaperone
MRNLCAVVMAAALVTSSAFAASNSDGLLAPGKPAGIQHAQSGSTVAMIVAGTAAFAMIAALVSGSGSGAAGGSNTTGGNTGGTTTTTTTKAATTST